MKKLMYMVVIPIFVITIFCITMWFITDNSLWAAYESLSIFTWFYLVLMYIIVIDSKKRWPNKGFGERAADVLFKPWGL